MRQLYLFYFCVVSTCASINALNILAVFPYDGKSHIYVTDPLINRLAEMGHEVTVISHFAEKNGSNNRKDIELIYNKPDDLNIGDLEEMELIPKYLSMFQVVVESMFLYDNGVTMCELMLKNTEVKELLNSGKKFDIALVEQFNSDCLLGILHRLNLKAVGIAPDIPMPWSYKRFGMITNPSYVPCHNLGYGSRPSFLETVTSSLVCESMRLGYYFRSILPTEKLLTQHLGEGIPPMNEMMKYVEVLLTNSYLSVSGALVLPPSVIGVGGIHLKQNQTLPTDIAQFIEESPHGVIFFSMGSMIRAVTFPPEKLKALQDAFAELPQRVMWKWENDTMPGIPKNVMIRKWLPQFDILNHENVKGFISHGGMLSTTEAAHCGVPIITIPMYGDQFANAAAAEESGLGTTLHFRDITKESILASLNKILDPKMQASAKKVSEIWRDRPMPPLETAVYWVEHVARHGGKHLRPASADLPLYRYLLLDVIAFLTFIGLLIIFMFYKSISCIIALILRSSPSRKNKKD